MGVALWLAQQALFTGSSHGLVRITALAALITVGLVAYGVAAILCGAGNLQALRPMIRRARAGHR
jgi:hypothetical protein